MPEHPRHPDTQPPVPSHHEAASKPSRPWWGYAIAVVVAALIVMLVVLHLTGAIGPGSH